MQEAAGTGPRVSYTQDYNFQDQVQAARLDLQPSLIDTLQINITKLCNQACVHCHVDASPRRREMMSDEIIAEVISILRKYPSLRKLDITGGAPELHPRFRELVTTARSLGKHVMVRHNLTVALEAHPITGESLTDLPAFFAAHKVEVISSLPYHQEFFTDKQRGSGVFKKSIQALRNLNALGYGQTDSDLTLNLVYNPVGSYLPAAQTDLERDYKRELAQRYDIHFNQLFALTNMPIHRFKAQLVVHKTYESYMEKLVAAFNPDAASEIMCRNLISVAYDGHLFDCDFNQMLELPLRMNGQPGHISRFDLEALQRRTIATADHCFGCTAGSGSSCGGSTANG
jgi:radical SAM/Cys-rich protein